MIASISSKRKPVFKTKTRWNFKRASWDIYKETSNELLSKIDMTSGDTEKMYDSITSAILKAASTAIPRGCQRNTNLFGIMNLN